MTKLSDLLREAMTGFDLFGVEDEPETDEDRERRAYTDMGRGDIVTLGGSRQKYRIFTSQGLIKYATIVGTKGKKFYQLRPEGSGSLSVGAYEVLSQLDGGKTASRPTGGPGKVKKVGHSAG